MKKILQRDNSLLREHSLEVDLDQIKTPRIQDILRDMQEAMHREDDSAAIAAPQIGVLLRIFIVSYSVLTENEDEKRDDLIFINPKIIKHSRSRVSVEEGCLSVRWLYGDVERYEKVTVEAYNELGERVVYGAAGIIAQAFQHEIDHLNGILFIDKAINVRDVPPEEQKSVQK